MKKTVALAAFVTAFSLVTGLAPAALAQSDLKSYYTGKNIDFLISTGEGATYDAYARALGRVMKKYMPGEPTFVPKQMVGAGGLTAANYIYNIAPKNGLVLGMVNNPVPFLPLLGEEHARYDSLRINWIGSAASETALLIASKESGVKTVDEAIAKGLTVGTTGAGSGSYFNANLINRFVGAKMKIISGYKASSDSLLALERGEVDGFPGIMLSTLHFAKPDWVRDGRINILMQLSTERHPTLPDVPTIVEKTPNVEEKAAVAFALAPLVAARPIMAPPDVPTVYIEALQTAFERTIQDSDFQAEIAKARIDTFGWMTGPQLTAFIQKMYKTDKAQVQAIAAILKQ